MKNINYITLPEAAVVSGVSIQIMTAAAVIATDLTILSLTVTGLHIFLLATWYLSPASFLKYWESC